MRIAQEIDLLYTDMRQAMTDRQTVSHNHYAKVIRNLAMMIAIVIRITTVMMITTRMMITTVSLCLEKLKLVNNEFMSNNRCSLVISWK